MQESFSENLKLLIRENGINQKKLGKGVGVSEASISNYCGGRERPSFDNLVNLANYFGVGLDRLVYGQQKIERLSAETIRQRQIEEAALRLDFRIDRQTKVLSMLSQSLETVINDGLRNVSKSLFSRYEKDLEKISSGLLFEDEVWNIEMCATETIVAYPTIDQNIEFDKDSGSFLKGPYFELQTAYLNKDNYSKYIEIYGGQVAKKYINAYRKLIKEVNGSMSAERVEILKTEYPVLTEVVLYRLDMQKLKSEFTSLYASVVDHIVDDELILIIGPSLIADVNFIVQGQYFDYARDYILRLVRDGVKI